MPGMARPNQICTIPLSIGGIPKDAKIVASWHTKDCDQTDLDNECSCMEPRKLTKEDFETGVLKPTSKQEDALDRINKFLIWGYLKLNWDLIDTGNNIMDEILFLISTLQ